MMSAFAWLNNLMTWLGKFFPRLQLVKRTEAGVLFGRGGRATPIAAGLCWYWPLIAELKVVPITPRTIEICAQLVGDETISIAVFWRIANPLIALTSLSDITGNLDDHAQSALSAACGAAATRLSNDDLRGFVLTLLRSRLEGSGLEISDIGIVHRGQPVAIKLINDWATHENVNR